MKKIKTLFILTSLLILGSCETFDLEQTESKSQVPVQLLDPVYAFNYVQLQLPVFVDDANDFTQRVTRQMAMTGGNTYDNAFKPVNFNTVWSDGYNILNAIKIMEPKSIEKNEYYALGASKLIRVYVLMTMVDMFGDIPYSEALQGNAILTPKFDKSADIYKGLFAEIDDAIDILNNPNDNSNSKKQDLYYTSKDSWITLANTLKLKLLNNARLAGSEMGIPDIKTAINNLISSVNIIDTPQEDFQFQYGNSRFNPNTRHPLYNDQYELGGGAYIANYFMWTLSEEKNPLNDPDKPALKDPRTDFYFYKQDPSAQGEDPFIIPFKTRPSHYNNNEYKSFFASNVLCTYFVSNWIKDVNNLPANGFWGRDHGDNSGIPQDGDKRTVAGYYPVGGKYGSNATSVQTGGTAGAQGAGIMPILLSSYVHFILAEFQLAENNNSVNAKVEMLSGISQSIDKVTAINKDNYPIISKTDWQYQNYPEGQYAPGTLIVNTDTGATNSAIVYNYSSYNKIRIYQKQVYIDYVSSKFDVLSDNDKKLELIMKEYYIAAWGNGIEPYNNYRRTGYPSNFQPTLEEASGSFFSTALYPGSVENNNPNMPPNVRTKKVFWDKLTKVLH